MPTILITGARQGLGLELARRCAEGGWRVLATCLEPDTAQIGTMASGTGSLAWNQPGRPGPEGAAG